MFLIKKQKKSKLPGSDYKLVVNEAAILITILSNQIVINIKEQPKSGWLVWEKERKLPLFHSNEFEIVIEAAISFDSITLFRVLQKTRGRFRPNHVALGHHLVF